MKKKLLGIIAGLVCCIGCVAAIMVMTHESEHENEHEHEHEDESAHIEQHADEAALMLTQRTDIKAVTVTSHGGSFTVNVSQDGSVQLAELSGVRQDEAREKALVDLCSEIKAVKLVEENAADMKKYGLEKPAGKARISYTGAEDVVVCVGDISPTGQQYYASVEGKKSVWLVESSVDTYFTGSAKDYVSQLMSPLPDKTAAQSARLTVTKKGSQGFVFERNGESWTMTAPINAQLDMKKASGCVNGLYGLNSQYCELVHPGDEDKKRYGTADAAVTVHLKDGEADITLYIGNEVPKKEEDATDKYYCYIKGVSEADCIYAVEKEYLPWVDMNVQGVISQVMLPAYLTELKSIVITAEGETSKYDIYNTEDSNDTTGKRTDKVTCAGKETDLTQFRKFYELLMSCPTEKIYTKEDKNDADITVVYNKSDGTADKLELVKVQDGFGARVNGKMSYLVPQSWCDTLLIDIKALASGESVKTEF